MSEDLSLLPPQHLEAERAILGAVMIDNKALERIPFLEPDDFYRVENRLAFAAMKSLADAGEPVDLITMRERFEAIGLITQVMMEAVTSANIVTHARMVREAAQKRAIIRVCRETIANTSASSVDELLAQMRTKTAGIATGHGGRLVSYRELMGDTVGFIEERFENRGRLSGIPSGFRDLDDMTDGWQAEELIIIGARPGMGKTAISQAWCENAGVPCGIIEIEMGRVQMGVRSVSRHSAISLWKLRKGFLGHPDWNSLTSAAAMLAAKEIYIDFTSQKLADIERSFTELVQTKGARMVVVDYLQLADASTKEGKSNRAQEVGETSRMLKRMSKTHGIPVIALAQINRKIEERTSKKPMLSDLRESGQIEQDADVIIFLYEDEQPNICCLDVAKGRNLGKGEVKIYWNKENMMFRDLEGGRYDTDAADAF